MLRWWTVLCFSYGALASGARAEQAATPPPTPPGVAVTLPWVAVNLVPSPELAIEEGGAVFGLGWQVTPLLYAFRLQPGLSRVRVLVAEPLVRHSGSLELYAQPEVFFRGRGFGESWLLASGLRTYLPVHGNGEYVSVSVAGGYVASQEWRRGRVRWVHSPSGEIGVYVMLGSLGVRMRHAPLADESAVVLTAKLSFF